MRVPIIKIPKIPEEEKTSIISQLMEIIEQQSVSIKLLEEEIQQLKDEIARLKGQKPKPKIRSSKLEKDPRLTDPIWDSPVRTFLNASLFSKSTLPNKRRS